MDSAHRLWGCEPTLEAFVQCLGPRAAASAAETAAVKASAESAAAHAAEAVAASESDARKKVAESAAAFAAELATSKERLQAVEAEKQALLEEADNFKVALDAKAMAVEQSTRSAGPKTTRSAGPVGPVEG